MNPQEHKCVLIIDQELSTGVMANVVSILSITIGHQIKYLGIALFGDKKTINKATSGLVLIG